MFARCPPSSWPSHYRHSHAIDNGFSKLIITIIAAPMKVFFDLKLLFKFSSRQGSEKVLAMLIDLYL